MILTIKISPIKHIYAFLNNLDSISFVKFVLTSSYSSSHYPPSKMMQFLDPITRIQQSNQDMLTNTIDTSCTRSTKK